MPCARTIIATSLAVAALSGCSGGVPDDVTAVASGDPSLCPGDVVDVLVSVGQWGDMARRLGGDCANVTTVVASGAVDPHDFQPDTGDLAAFSDADLVVLNGGRYEEWAEDALAALDREPVVVSAAEVAGASGYEDPHLWNDPRVVQETAAAVTEQLRELSPDALDYFNRQELTWQEELRPYLEAVAELRSTAAGATFAATEGVFDRMAETIGLVDVTPEGYRRAAGDGSEPSPGDLAAFEAALTEGRVDVLIHNSGTSGSGAEQLRAVAEDADVPVVEVTESPEDPEESFVSWQLDQLVELSEALAVPL